MKIRTLIEAGQQAHRAAILEKGEAVSFGLIPNRGDITGPLYLARVKKVDPKINAAFLDLGGAGEAFLPYRQAKALKEKLASNISSLVHEGELILVKIVADKTEHDKLPLATANPMIGGRYALSGHLKGKGFVARSFADEKKRRDLQKLLEKNHSGTALIIRSPAAGVEAELIEKDIRNQAALWESLETKSQKPGQVLPALDPVEKILRDFAPEGVDEILVDDKLAYLKAKKLAEEKWPDLKGRIKPFEEGPIMEAFGVEERLDYVREGRVPLPSGGNITIEETSAMTVIDVNSGAGRKGTAPGALYFSTNLEAAGVIGREIRFQNLFGIITIDFIDLKTRGEREKVENQLKKALQNDPRAVEMTGINRFGLLTLKRARRGQTLKTLLEQNL